MVTFIFEIISIIWRNMMGNLFALKKLFRAEDEYLSANGWVAHDLVAWFAPESAGPYAGQKMLQERAVRTQKDMDVYYASRGELV